MDSLQWGIYNYTDLELFQIIQSTDKEGMRSVGETPQMRGAPTYHGRLKIMSN
jgi:hypothetical protein